MAAITGYQSSPGRLLFEAAPKSASVNLSQLEALQFPSSLAFGPTSNSVSGTFGSPTISYATRQLTGTKFPNFFEDYYFRVHVSPLTLDLQTVASSQTRRVSLWNAFPYTSAQLTGISISDTSGIEIAGQQPPFAMNPLKELNYDVTVGVSGSPNIDARVQFQFGNVTNPAVVAIVGTRAIKFDIIPEGEVKEVWSWLTDNIVSVNGTEQRIALLGAMPRIEQTFKILFDDTSKLRNFYSNLISSVGRLWMPEYQYATRITADAAQDTSTLVFDATRTDIRDGEYIMVLTPKNSILLQIDKLTDDGATIVSPLTDLIPKGSLVMPGSSALVADGTQIGRYAPNTGGETSLTCKMIRDRSSLLRTNAAPTISTFNGVYVLDKRPLANDEVQDAVTTGQQTVDNNTGLQDIVSRWLYSRIGGSRTYLVHRMLKPEEVDYWKAIFDYMRGNARRVWVPTYRDDMNLLAAPSDGGTAISIEACGYSDKIFPIPTHRFIEFETASGIHRATVTGATLSDAGELVAFSPALPAGAGWTQVKRVSFLLPMRLSGDAVTWTHHGLESTLEFSLISAEVPQS